MPDTVTTFRNRRISLGWAVAIMGVVLTVLTIVLAYGNDYASCVRTLHVREQTNAFWGSIADVRATSARRSERYRKRTAGKPGATEKLLADFFKAQRDDDRRASKMYRSHAHQPVPDCSSFPPPTD